MKRSLKLLVLPLLAMCGLTSCLNDGPEQSVLTIDYGSNDLLMGYSSSSMVSPGQPLTMTTAPSIRIARDISNNTLSFMFINLMNPGASSYSFETESMPYNFSDDQLSISMPAVMASGVMISNFTFIAENDWFSLSMDVNGVMYYITTSWTYYNTNTSIKGIIYEGNTLVQAIPGNPFTPNDPIKFILSPNGNSADLYLMGATFAANMPLINMVIKGIPFSMTPSGFMLNSTEPIEPYQVGYTEPFSQYVINNFRMTVPYNGRNGSINFNCSSSQWPVDVTDLHTISAYSAGIGTI